MKKKRISALLLSTLLLLPSLTFLSGCGSEKTITLRVFNWEEYIDEGDDESNSIIEDFELWYRETYPDRTPVSVEYSTFGTNEDMYNQLQLGDKYDLLCPSDYMIMKLAAEEMLEPYDESFFDETNELNYYIRNVSPYIQNVFESNKINKNSDEDDATWSDYAAGYMWGVTGFMYNENATPTIREDLNESGFDILRNPKYKNTVTTKDNVRDTYFAALAIASHEEIAALNPADEDYSSRLAALLNRTDEETAAKVETVLYGIDKNIYSYETDSGKADIVSGKINIYYAWSGDAVYAMTPEENENPALRDSLCFFVPNDCSNLFFDGWVMPKGAKKAEAQAFVNFLSMPENAVRNMNYIGYSCVIAGDEVLDYLKEGHEVEASEDAVLYDLSYFFGDTVEDATFYADARDASRKTLFAHFPPYEVTSRCAVMDYYGKEASERINELWARVKSETLDAWAVIVIIVTVATITGGMLFMKFGSNIDFFRTKPKKGYYKVETK